MEGGRRSPQGCCRINNNHQPPSDARGALGARSSDKGASRDGDQQATLESWLGLSSRAFEEGEEEAIDELRAKVELPFLKGYKCRLCSAVFVSITDLERHLRYWHGLKSPV